MPATRGVWRARTEKGEAAQQYAGPPGFAPGAASSLQALLTAATAVELAAARAGQRVGGLYGSAPDGAFLGFQAVALLLRLGAGLLLGIYLGGLAAGSGAQRALAASKPAANG